MKDHCINFLSYELGIIKQILILFTWSSEQLPTSSPLHLLPTDMIPDVYRSLLLISSAPLFNSDLVKDTSIAILTHFVTRASKPLMGEQSLIFSLLIMKR